MTDKSGNATTKFYQRLFDRIKENKVSLKNIHPDDWLQLEAICCQLNSTLADDVIMFAAGIEKEFNNCLKYYRPRRATSGIFFPQQSKKAQRHILYCLNKLAITSSHHLAIAEKVSDQEEREIFLSKATEFAESIDAHLEIVYSAIKIDLDYDKTLKIAEKEIKKAVLLSKSLENDQKILTGLSNARIPKACAFFLREDLKAIVTQAIAEKTPKNLPTTNLPKSSKISQE